MSTIAHEDARRSIEALADGRLGATERLALEAHLATCPACRAQADALAALEERIAHALHARWDSGRAPAGTAQRVQARAMGATMSRRTLGLAGALAGMAVLAVMIFAIGSQFERALVGMKGGTPPATSTARIHSEPVGTSFPSPAPRLPNYASLVYSFADSQHGWIAQGGPDGGTNTIWATSDGGNTWEQRVTLNSAVLALDFVSQQQGWAGTSAQGLLVTRDGGATWQPVPGADMLRVERVDFADAEHGWISSREPVLQTADSGQTWTPVNIPCKDAPYNLKSFDLTGVTSAWLICGNGGGTQCQGEANQLWRTQDGGASWELVNDSTGTATPEPYVPPPRPTKMPGGPSPWLPQGCFSGMSFADDANGWVSSVHGALWSTADGGHTWESVPGIGNQAADQMYAASPQLLSATQGYVVTWLNSDFPDLRYQGPMLVGTQDGGVNWQTLFPFEGWQPPTREPKGTPPTPAPALPTPVLPTVMP